MNDNKELGASAADATDRATDAPHGADKSSPPSGSVSTGAWTPGPWYWTPRECEGRRFEGLAIVAERGYCVATSDSNEANAALIASAPALYEALGELQRMSADIPAVSRNPRFGALRMKALAALAKARGES